MQIVVIQRRGHEWVVPLHGAVKEMAKEPRTLLDACRQGNEPLRRNQPLLVALRLVDEDLRTERVNFEADQSNVEKVDAHPPRGVRNLAGSSGGGKLDTSERREVTVMDATIGS